MKKSKFIENMQRKVGKKITFDHIQFFFLIAFTDDEMVNWVPTSD